MVKYGETFKPTKDLLSKFFSFNKTVEVKSKTANGVTFTSDATIQSRGASCNVKAEYQYGNLKLDKLQISTEQRMALEMSLAEAFPGGKLTFKATDGTRADAELSSKLGVEYVAEPVALTAEVDAVTGPINATATVNMDGIIVGGSVATTYKGEKAFAPTDYNALLAYKTPEFTVGVQTEKCLSKYKASIYHDASQDVKVAAQVGIAGSDVAVDIGGSYRVSPDATVYAKVNQKGVVSASYVQQLNALTKMQASGEIEAANIGANNHRFGLKFTFTA